MFHELIVLLKKNQMKQVKYIQPNKSNQIINQMPLINKTKNMFNGNR